MLVSSSKSAVLMSCSDLHACVMLVNVVRFLCWQR